MLAVLLLAQAGVTDPTGSLIQYGALGILAGLAVVAVRVLFAREAKALDLERERANRLEAELKALNDTVRDKYLTTLAEATKAISQALSTTREGR